MEPFTTSASKPLVIGLRASSGQSCYAEAGAVCRAPLRVKWDLIASAIKDGCISEGFVFQFFMTVVCQNVQHDPNDISLVAHSRLCDIFSHD